MMTLFSYIIVILIWGTTPLAVQWSGEGVSPFLGATLRMLLAIVMLLLLLRVLRIPLPMHVQARKIYAVSILGQGLSMLMIYWSSTYLASGLVSLIFGFSPLITGLLAWYLYRERLSLFQCASIALGIFGLMLAISQNLPSKYHDINIYYVEALLIMLLACSFFSLSNIWIKRFSTDVDIHPLAMATGSVLFSLPLYAICIAVEGVNLSEIHLTSKSAGSIVYLAILGSVVAPFCFFKVLKVSSASMIALITVVTPIIALILGAWLNGELVGPRVIAGAVFVLASLLLFQYDTYLPRGRIKPNYSEAP